jgi:two-component system sensor histidine kinase BaeS
MGAGELETRVRETGDEEVRAVAHALNALASTLQHEEEVRKANVADLAHELRTPLMGLLGRIEAAQDGVLTDDDANLAAMHDEALRLGRLLDDLSTLADAERPGMLLTLERVDLAEVAAGQVLAAASGFSDKGIAWPATSRRPWWRAIAAGSTRWPPICSPTRFATPTRAAR